MYFTVFIHFKLTNFMVCKNYGV